jgi:FkbM family methyltransferase
MQQLFDQVYAFEPHPHLAETLRHLGPPTKVFNLALSDREGHMQLHVPLQDSKTLNGRQVTVPLYGWSTLSPSSESSRLTESQPSYQTHTVKVAPLDAFGFGDVALIKINVEGHEMEVLQGACSTLERNRPTVIIEVQVNNQKAVGHFFHRIGCDRHSLSDLVREKGTSANEIYLPSESSHVPQD